MKLYRRSDQELTWYVEYRDADNKRVRKSTHCEHHDAAKAIGLQWEKEAAEGITRVHREATLGEGVDLLLEHFKRLARAGKGSEATTTFYTHKAKVLVDHWTRDKLLKDLSPTDVDSFVEQLRTDGYSEHTIKKELTTVSLILGLSKRARIWKGDIDELMPLRFGSSYKPRERVLAPDELNSLLGRLLPDRAAFIAFAVATSARWSEALAAQWVDVQGDLAFVLDPRFPFYVKLNGTKTELSARTVPIVAPWQRTLMAYVFRHAMSRETKTGSLFMPWGTGNNVRELERACTKAGIDSISLNDCRRTHATWMRTSKVDLPLISGMMGHADTTMVQRVYARLSPEQLGSGIRDNLNLPQPTQATPDLFDRIMAGEHPTNIPEVTAEVVSRETTSEVTRTKATTKATNASTSHWRGWLDSFDIRWHDPLNHKHRTRTKPPATTARGHVLVTDPEE